MDKHKTSREPSRRHLMAQIARLESMNDQLQTEVSAVDELLRAVGFEEGLVTLKSAVLDCLASE